MLARPLPKAAATTGHVVDERHGTGGRAVLGAELGEAGDEVGAAGVGAIYVRIKRRELDFTFTAQRWREKENFRKYPRQRGTSKRLAAGV